jgi:plasmid maintenance system antidote protein VapI
MPLTDEIITDAHLRAQCAVAKVALYRVGARAGIHPSRLSGFMNGSVPLTPEIASRISAAIEAEAAAAD